MAFAQPTDATLTSAVIGAGSVSKTGAGTLILTNNNTYTGTTTISAGTLQLGNGGTQSTIGGIIFGGTSTSVATLAIEKAAQPAGGGTFSNVLSNFGDDDVLNLKGLAFSNALGNGAFYNLITRQLTVSENGVH